MTKGAEQIIQRIKELDRLDKNFFNYIFNHPDFTLEIFIDEYNKIQMEVTNE